MERNRKTEQLVDEALAESFPASDPPWFMAAGGVGAPAHPQETARISESDNTHRNGPAGLALNLPG